MLLVKWIYLFVTFSWTHHIRPLHNRLLDKLATCLSDSCIPCALITQSVSQQSFSSPFQNSIFAFWSLSLRMISSELRFHYVLCIVIHNSVYSSTNIVQFTFRHYQIGLQVTFIVTDSPKNRPQKDLQKQSWYKRIHQYFSSTICLMLL